MAYNPNNPNGQATMANSAPVVIASDQSAVAITDNGGSLTVDGTVTVQQATAANLNATVVGTGTFAVQAAQSATWNVGLNAGTNYVGKVRLTDGTTDAEIIPLTGYDAQAVGIVDSSGNQLSGPDFINAQYLEGDPFPLFPTGLLTLTNSDSNNLYSLRSDVNGNLKVTGGAIFGLETYTEGTSLGLPIAAVRRDANTSLVDTTNELAPLQVNALGGLKVGADVAVPVNVQIGNATLTAGVIDETGAGAVDALAIGGGTAHDAVDSGNPVKIGFQAETSLPTAVANADRANGISDRYGRQLIAHIDPSMQTWKSAEYTTTQTGANIWVPTAGNRFVITSLHITTGGTTGGLVTIWGAQTGTTAYSAGTDQVFFRGSLIPTANSAPGAIIQPFHPFYSDTLNDCLKITTSANMTIYIQVNGYEITP